jgi:catechol 2,3-dioxygenase-like lactoylglutathione lyase family enzyme
VQIHDLAPLLNVADLGRSLAFYRDALGFAAVEDYELDGQILWAALQSGDAKLMLHEAPQSDPSRGRRASYADLVLYLYVEDAAAAHAALDGLGFAPGPIEQEDVGLVEFYLRDPDGYEIGIGSPLPPWVKKGER